MFEAPAHYTECKTAAERVRWAMNKVGIKSVAELAQKTGLEKGTVRTIVNGTRNPGKWPCHVMEPVLGVDAIWIETGIRPGTPTKEELALIKAQTEAFEAEEAVRKAIKVLDHTANMLRDLVK